MAGSVLQPVQGEEGEKASFFTKPDRVEAQDKAVVLEKSAPLGALDQDVYVVPVGATEDLQLRVLGLRLRDKVTGEERDLDLEAPGDSPEGRAISGFRSRVTLSPFGTFRRLATALVRVDRRGPLPFDQRSYEIASYRLAVEFSGGAEPGQSAGDSGFESGLYRKLVDTMVVEPSLVDRYARGGSQSPFEGPTAWQPRGELSPGLPWVMIPVAEDGVYGIDGRWLTEAGLDVATVKPEDLYLVSNGEQVPMEVVGPEGVGFRGGQRLVFYGLGNESRETRERMYYLGRRPEGVSPRGFTKAEEPAGDAPTLNQYTRSQRVERDEIFQTRLGTFLSIQAMTWVWQELPRGAAVDVPFDLPGLVSSGADDATTATVRLYPADLNVVGELTLTAEIGGQPLGSQVIDRRDWSATFSVPNDRLQAAGNTMRMTLTTNVPAAQEQRARPIYLDAMDLQYRSLFEAQEGGHILRPAAGHPLPEGPHRLVAAGFRSQRLIALDVENPEDPRRLTVKPARGAALVGADLSGVGKLILLEDGFLRRPPAARRSAWVDWTSREHSADVLVIYHKVFKEAAELLAEDLRKAGHQALTVDVEGVYEAFSHGSLSSEAIRDFLAVAVNEWTGRRPFSAILIGDSTGDGRNVSRQDLPNYMPAHELAAGDGARTNDLYVSDSYYSWLSGEDEATDLIIGRLSPLTAEEAMNTVRNLIAHRAQQEERHPWGRRLLGIADTGEFTKPLRGVLSREAPDTMVEKRVLAADEMPWEDNYYLPEHLLTRAQDAKVSPLLTASIEQGINDGAAMLVYLGHGAPNIWSNSRYWFGGGTPNSDILRLANKGRLPFIASFTCNNAVVNYPLKPWNISIAEDFMRHADKGAVACFMPSGPGFVPNHEVMSGALLRAWTQVGIREHGLLAELARIGHQAELRIDDHSRMFLLLGDPTLKQPPLERLEATGTPSAEDEMRLLAVNSLDGAETPTRRRWTVLVKNGGLMPQAQQLRVELVGAGGERVDGTVEEIELQGGEARLVAVELEVPGPGGYYAEFTLPASSHAAYGGSFPTRQYSTFFAVPEPGGRPVAVRQSILAAAYPNQSPRLLLDVVNTSPEMAMVGAEATFSDDQVTTKAQTQGPATLQSATYAGLALDAELPRELPGPVRVQTALLMPNEGHRMELPPFVITPESLPDLEVVRDSLRVTPEAPSDGVTIFVDGVLRNGGGSTSSPTTLGLYEARDGGFATPLRDMTRSTNPISIGPMAPGEERPFRLRWDPYQNAGPQRLRVAVDPQRLLLESEKDNNTASVDVTVRTKWKLAPGVIRVARGTTEGTIALIAQVTNTGETDAQRVTVNFYTSEQQTEATKVGEILLERVPAGKMTEATLEWAPKDTATFDARNFRPTFTLALKGSQQRVSSVTQ